MARPRTSDEGLRNALLDGAARTIARGGVEGLVMRRLAGQLVADGMAPLDAALARLQASGLLRKAPPLQAPFSMWASVHGVVDLERGLLQNLLSESVREAFYEEHLQAIVRAWRADGVGRAGPTGG